MSSTRLRTLLVLVGITLATVSSTAFPAAAQTPRTTTEGYIQRLDAASQVATDHLDDPSPEAMDELRAALGLPLVVDTAGGPVTIERDGFLDDLEGGRPADFSDARDHLAALRDAAAETLSMAPLPPADVLDSSLQDAQSADTEVTRSEPSLLTRIWRWILGTFEGADTTLEVILRIALWVIVLTVLGMMVWLIWRFRPRPARFGPGEDDEGEGRDARARDWRRIAREAAARGDLTEAIRASYRLLVRTLARRGFVPRTPGLTSGECRTEVERRRPELGPSVRAATSAFERVAYGEQEARRQDLEVLVSAEREAARS